MDPALALLWKLKSRALLRRWGKNFRSAKGVGLTLVGLLVFVPWMASIFLSPKEAIPWDIDGIRRYGPLALLAYAALGLVTSVGDRGLVFSPPEIDFLFTGPFSRRALLVYKLAGVSFGVAFSALFIAVAFHRGTPNFLAGFVASFLTLMAFQLLLMEVSLLSNTVAAFATGSRRKIILGAILALAAAALVPIGSGLIELPRGEILRRVEGSPVIRAATIPFRPFVYAFTSSRLWPDFLGWTSACFALVSALAYLVFESDAQFLESTAASSARIYEQIKRARQGGAFAAIRTSPRRARFGLPMPPWLGGVGPVFWRQLSTAVRDPLRPLAVFLIIGVPTALILYGTSGWPEGHGLGPLAPFATLAVILWASVVVSPMVAFDFRGDIDRMEELKALPISSMALAIGQLLTPVLLFLLPQWICFAAATAWLPETGPDYLAAALMPLPVVLLLFGLDNLLFLVFPTRIAVANFPDFTTFGRQMLLILAKFVALAIVVGAGALAGAGVSFLFMAGRTPALFVGLVTGMGLALATIPLIALAFRRYDVASDTPA